MNYTSELFRHYPAELPAQRQISIPDRLDIKSLCGNLIGGCLDNSQQVTECHILSVLLPSSAPHLNQTELFPLVRTRLLSSCVKTSQVDEWC